jgi:hypothetical protein
VTVSPGDGSPFPPLVAELASTGEGFDGFLTGVPAGAGRLFEIDAYDQGGTLVARGAGKGDVEAGATAEIAILIQPDAVATVVSAVPVFDLLAASATRVGAGGAVTLQASAHDPASTDRVAYRWTATCGSFDDPTRPSVTWTAPGDFARCDLALAVTSGGGVVQVGLAIVVAGP